MKPSEMVKELDRFVIGQDNAKRAVAIAWRSRWRRQRLPDAFRQEVTPKNILMRGPTGCGKTEVARRLARLSHSPFVKVEATKFTEVGYVGKDVSSIVEDLVAHAFQIAKDAKQRELGDKLKKQVESKILKTLMGNLEEKEEEYWRKQLNDGHLDNMNIDIEVPKEPDLSTILTRQATRNPYLVLSAESSKGKMVNVPVSRGKEILLEQELKKLTSENELIDEAIKLAENDGIVFIDEIDKICGSDTMRGDRKVSQEGVQRDLLPLIEGTTVAVQNYGKIKTDHILFICAGAFHDSKPSDLMPEFQGRLPVRVELDPLTVDDLHRILTETDFNLIDQQIEMLKTEGCGLQFTQDAVKEIAKVAADCNDRIENIGARRLITVIERVMEDMNMEAAEAEGKEYAVDKDYVQERVKEVMDGTDDLDKFIL